MLVVFASLVSVTLGWIDHSCGSELPGAHYDGGIKNYDVFNHGSQIMGISGYSWEEGCTLCAMHALASWVKDNPKGDRNCFYCTKDIIGIYLMNDLNVKDAVEPFTVKCATPSYTCWGPLCARRYLEESLAGDAKLGIAAAFCGVAVLAGVAFAVSRKWKGMVVDRASIGDETVLLA